MTNYKDVGRALFFFTIQILHPLRKINPDLV